MTVIVNDFLESTVTIQDTAGSVASLDLTLIHTDETPLVPLTSRVKAYLSSALISVDWGTNSKIFAASLSHFAQKTHNQFLKVAREIPKGILQTANSITVTSELAILTDASHALSPGDEVTILGAASAGLNGLKKLIDTPTSGTFTFAAPGVGDGADANNGSIDYHVGDADLTTALDVIFAEDKNWIQLHSVNKSKADILDIAAWAVGKNIIYGASSEDADVKVKGSGNVLASLEAFNYSNTYYVWRHSAAVDATSGVTIEVSPTIGSNDINTLSFVATLTSPFRHGRSIGDQVTVSGAAEALLNGLKTITGITTETSFTFAAPGVGDGADANNGSIDYEHTDSEIATVTKVGHGLRVEDPLTVFGAAPGDLNGNKTVQFVVDSSIFTYAALGVADGAATGSITYFARYTFFEVGISAFMLSKLLGSISWDANGGFGTVQGQIATPQNLLSESELVNIIGVQDGTGGQSGNVYVNRLGFDVFTKGWMVNRRFIENETVRIFLEQRIAEAIMAVTAGDPGKKPFTNSGLNIYLNAVTNPINTQLDRTGLLPLSDAEMDAILDTEVGVDDLFQRLPGFLYIYKDMDLVDQADRLVGNVPSPEVFVKIGQAIHRIEINVFASV